MEMKCLIDPLGRGYTGTKTDSSTGRTCLAWKDVANVRPDMNIILPDQYQNDAANYCRYIPFQNWTGPSCMVDIGGKDYSYVINETCDIPYCRKQYFLNKLSIRHDGNTVYPIIRQLSLTISIETKRFSIFQYNHF